MSCLLIDGSVLEGGGQILRNSVSLSALLAKPITIKNIRQGRKPPGLKNQHRVGIQLAVEICRGRVSDMKNGSTEVDFHPATIHLPCRVTADCVTAGATTLLLQTALPMLLFSPTNLPTSTLVLRGGTNASFAPQIEYTQHILIPFMKRHFGVDNKLEVVVKKRGYFPKGGGELFVSVPGRSEPLKSFQLTERGSPIRIGGLSHVGRLPSKLATEMAEGALKRLAEAGFGGTASDTAHTDPKIADNSAIPIDIATKREPDNICLGAGSGIVLWAELQGGGVIGGSALGKKGLSSTKVGEAAADELIKGLQEGGCVDEHLQDQIIIFMALASGRSAIRTGPLRLHTKTAIWVAEQLTDAKFEVVEESSGQCVISCEGIAYTSSDSSSSC